MSVAVENGNGYGAIPNDNINANGLFSGENTVESQGNKEVSNWSRAKKWVKTHKREIAIALIIIGIAIMALGLGLAIGMGTGGAVLTHVALTYSVTGGLTLGTTTLTVAGKCVVAGSILAASGAFISSIGFGMFFGKKRRRQQNQNETEVVR